MTVGNQFSVFQLTAGNRSPGKDDFANWHHHVFMSTVLLYKYVRNMKDYSQFPTLPAGNVWCGKYRLSGPPNQCCLVRRHHCDVERANKTLHPLRFADLWRKQIWIPFLLQPALSTSNHGITHYDNFWSPYFLLRIPTATGNATTNW